MTSRHRIEEAIKDVPGVRRVYLCDPLPFTFSVVVEGGDFAAVRLAIDDTRAVGISASLKLWRAPLWWRVWSFLKGLVTR